MGYGNGESDYFLVEFTQVETGDYHRVSSAIDQIVASNVAFGAYGAFRLSLGGKTTSDISIDTSDVGLESILEKLHDFQLDVQVTKTIVNNGATRTITWQIMYLTMLNVWQSMPPSGINTGTQLLLVAPTSYGLYTGTSLGVFNSMNITRPANKGIYPVEFTLWHTGSYDVRITNNGVDIQGSPTVINVANALVDSTASLSSGQGLTGGVAGEPITVQIQAMDTHQSSIQYITSKAYVTSYVQEVQRVTIASTMAAGHSFYFSFRGFATEILTTGISYQAVATAINTLPADGTVKLTLVSSSTSGSLAPGSDITSSSEVMKAGDVFQVTFNNLYGSLPLLSAGLVTGGVQYVGASFDLTSLSLLL